MRRAAIALILSLALASSGMAESVRPESVAAADDTRAAEARGDHAAAAASAAKALLLLGHDLKWNDARILEILNLQGDAYASLGKREEAEVAYRMVEERTRLFAPPDPSQALDSRIARAHAISGIADILADRGELADAEELARKAFGITSANLPADDELVALMRNRLANVLAAEGKSAEASAILADGPRQQGETIETALQLKTEALIDRDAGKAREGEAKLRRAVQIIGRMLGEANDISIAYRNDLANYLIGEDDYPAAEAVLREAISLAGDGDAVARVAASCRASLAYTLAAQERWDDAYIEASTAARAFEGWIDTMGGNQTYGPEFIHDLVAVAAWHVMAAHPERRDEMMAVAFEAMQHNQAPQAAAALLQMAARNAAGDPDLAAAVRLFQDQQLAFAGNERAELAKLGGKGLSIKMLYSGAGGSAREKLDKARNLIASRFPAYQSLAGLKALPLADVPPLLADDEVMVVPYVGRSQVEASTVWAITRENIWWVPVDAAGLDKRIAELRAMIDPSGGTRGVSDAGDASPAETRIGGFDTAAAASIYRQLFGDVDELILSKHRLIVVPSPSLAALPFEALARGAAPEGKDVRAADWLVRHEAISVLPSVTSLKSLRELAKPVSAAAPFIGFGNPETEALKMGLAPLPGTVTELHSLAQSLGAAEDSVHLADHATAAELEASDMASYRVVAFATHGLLPGDVSDLKEPALVLSPSAGDDGLLTASRIAALKLDADFVILSACNTAGGDARSGEGLSGLARAFFYAGARALLVSHWPVYSDAAVKLTTATLKELAAEPAIGRDEALRRAMVAILDKDPDPRHWEPAYWAPFALVGANR